MKYIQWLIESSGYIPGSNPPKYSEAHKRPIDLLGSDGVSKVDGRLCLSSIKAEAASRWSRHISKRRIIGYRIISADNFMDDGQELHKCVHPKFISRCHDDLNPERLFLIDKYGGVLPDYLRRVNLYFESRRVANYSFDSLHQRMIDMYNY